MEFFQAKPLKELSYASPLRELDGYQVKTGMVSKLVALIKTATIFLSLITTKIQNL
jgi:hypothetical protein